MIVYTMPLACTMIDSVDSIVAGEEGQIWHEIKWIGLRVKFVACISDCGWLDTFFLFSIGRVFLIIVFLDEIVASCV